MPPRLFISYAKEDATAADAICAALERRGLSCWIAPRDLAPGAKYAEAIIEAIDAAPTLVLLFSSNTNRSSHVPTEVERAFHKRARIVTVRLEDVTPTKELEYFTSSSHWLDVGDRPLQERIEEVADKIADASPADRPTAIATPPAAMAAREPRSPRRYILIGGAGMAVLVIAAVAMFFGPDGGETRAASAELPAMVWVGTSTGRPTDSEITLTTPLAVKFVKPAGERITALICDGVHPLGIESEVDIDQDGRTRVEGEANGMGFELDGRLGPERFDGTLVNRWKGRVFFGGSFFLEPSLAKTPTLAGTSWTVRCSGPLGTAQANLEIHDDLDPELPWLLRGTWRDANGTFRWNGLQLGDRFLFRTVDNPRDYISFEFTRDGGSWVGSWTGWVPDQWADKPEPRPGWFGTARFP